MDDQLFNTLMENLKKGKYMGEDLTKAQRQQAAMAMPSLTDGLVQLLREQGFQTGSSMYSNSPPNDIDWVINCPPEVFSDYAVNVSDPGYWENDGMTIIYANYRGQLYNIICMADYRRVDAWRKTTGLLRLLRVEDELITKVMDVKWKRVRLFRALVDILWDGEAKPLPIDRDSAWKHHKCIQCGREAINFMDAPSKRIWEETAICERCRA